MEAGGSEDGSSFSHDVSRMPDFPPRNPGHRRAQSEILTLPDDISFEADLGVIGSSIDGPSLSDEADDDVLPLFLDGEKPLAPCATSSAAIGGGSSSVNPAASAVPFLQGRISPSASGERPRVRHQHSQSMDGSTSIKTDMLESGGEGPSHVESKKAMSAQDLADLALVDPKRAKRIWANRQSAARSKERKMRYIQELERRVQTLQAETTTMSAQMSILERDNDGLTAENNELNLLIDNINQQVRLQDALVEALREEVNRMKVVTGQLGTASQMMPSGRQVMGGGYGASFFGSNGGSSGQQQFNHHGQTSQSLLAAQQQLQQLQIHSQQQLQRPQLQLPRELQMEGLLPSPSRNGSPSDAPGGVPNQ